jgi:Skp family chaperone for outer membrane proteins
MTSLRPLRLIGRRAAGRVALAAICVGVALGATPASAVLYKWVDASGRVTYSDQPPPGNAKAEVVGAPAPASNASAVRDLANQEADFKKQQTQRADDQKKAAKTRTEQLQLQQDCTDARARLKLYQSNEPIGRIEENGQQVLIDDIARRETRDRLEQQIRERCSG